MGIDSKASMLISAKYKDFDKADTMFGKIKRAAAVATFATLEGKQGLQDFTKAIPKSDRDFQSAFSNMTRIERNLARVGKVANTTGSFIKGIFAIGAYLGMDKMLGGLTDFYIGLVNNQKAAARLGMTLTNMSAAGYAFEQIGINAEDGIKAMTTLNDLANKARFGDVTSKKILGPEIYGSEYKSPADLTRGMHDKYGHELSTFGTKDSADNTFGQFREQVNKLKTPAERAARALTVLGDDAFLVSSAFTLSGQDRFKAHEGVGQGIYGGSGKQIDSQRMDEIADKIRFSAIVFHNASSQFKVVMMEWGSAFMSIFTDLMHQVMKEAGGENSLPSLVRSFVEGIVNFFPKIYNVLIEIAKLVDRILTNATAKNVIAEKTTPVDYEKLVTASVNSRWDGMKMKGDWKLSDTPPTMFGSFNATSAANRAMLLMMDKVKNVTDSVPSIVESNKTTHESLVQALSKLNMQRDLGVLPKDTFMREAGNIILRAENAISSRSLAMMNPSRMFSQETESLISRINMERQVKNRDPMERLIRVAEQSRVLSDLQLKALEGLLRMSREDLEKLGWGKQ